MSEILTLSRAPGWRSVQPGDAWTFIYDEPICLGGVPAKVGDVIAWLPEDAPAEIELLFRVVRIWPPFTYECVSRAQPLAYRHRSHLARDLDEAAP